MVLSVLHLQTGFAIRQQATHDRAFMAIGALREAGGSDVWEWRWQ